MAWEYNPLYNLVKNNPDGEGKPPLSGFDTDKLEFDINHPVDIECQPSYDGSVNLLLNDDCGKPRIINSGFSVLEDNTYERVARNQRKTTNVYDENTVHLTTQLQRTIDKEVDSLKIDLEKVVNSGELKGGNYTFLIKYGDDDDNMTRFVAESGIVSVFKQLTGTTVLGTLEDELANASVTLRLTNVDRSFSKLHVYYRRNYSDLTGTIQREYCKLTEPYKISDTEDQNKPIFITITGVEPVEQITYDDIIKQFNTYNTVKTHTQVQNMLFFGNVTEPCDEESLLQKLSYNIEVKPEFGNTLNIDNLSKYTNPKNIYDNLGYMPGEYYRIGIVYVYDDESVSQVYNLRGCVYNSLGESNIDPAINSANIGHSDILIGNHIKCFNTRGVFRMPEVVNQLISTESQIYPIVLKTNIKDEEIAELKKLGIKGYFFVRQARIPLFLGQGLSIGISEAAGCPLIHNDKYGYGVFTPVTGDKYETAVNYYLQNNHIVWFNPDDQISIDSVSVDGKTTSTQLVTRSVKTKGLICAESFLVPQMQSILDSSEFVLKPVAKYKLAGIEERMSGGEWVVDTQDSLFQVMHKIYEPEAKTVVRSLTYVPAETPSRIINSHKFSTKAGSSVDVRSSKSLYQKYDTDNKTNEMYPVLDNNIIRGNFGAFVGVCGDELEIDTVYNIYSSEYPGEHLQSIKSYIEKLSFNNNEFYTITDKYYFKNTNSVVVKRGDCFYNDVSVKMQYNFLDHQAPLNTTIVDSQIVNNFGEKGEHKLAGQPLSKISADGWLEINSSDWNAVHFGYVIKYSNMSNYNLGIRSINDQHTDERALFGDLRTFYPYSEPKPSISFKIPESTILPMGNSSTLGCFPYFVAEQVPFNKKHFDNRIAFSNVQANDSFANSYRVFTGLSYQDIERTYGAITKLVPLGANLFCVFEHGCGIVPINEKALLSTMQGQSIHLYGSQVIQSQVTVVSQDYGSTWEDSIIVTPNGIYGVDTFAKKIWRYTSQGFSLISDQLVQRFLNDNITLSEADVYPIVAVKNIKSHYNNHKGDVMFTFYDDDKCWNLCYNERIDKFTTRYTWTPLLSENIQNSFVSIDRDTVETYAIMAKNMEKGKGKLYFPNPKLDYSTEAWGNKIFKGFVGNYETTKNGEFVLDKDGNKIEVMEEIGSPGFYNYYNLNLNKYNEDFSLVEAKIKSVSYTTWDSKNNKTVVHTVINDEEHCFKHEMQDKIITLSSSESKDNLEKVTMSDKNAMFCLKWGDDLLNMPVLHSVEESYDPITWDIPQDDYESDELRPEEDVISHEQDDHGYDLNIAYNNFKINARNYVAVEKGDKLRLEIKLNDFVCWIKIELEVTPYLEIENKWKSRAYSTYTKLKSFKQTLCLVPDYEIFTKRVNEQSVDSGLNYTECKESYDKVNRIGFYTHGRAGIYDEINYTDADPDNQIKPTFWYNKQEPFEFEFVVNTGAGMQKIFNNLVIISNNAEPESLEFSIMGDAYDFNKAGIFGKTLVEPIEDEYGIIDSEKTLQAKLEVEYQTAKEIPGIKDAKYSTRIDNGSVSRDTVLQQYYLHVEQPCRNIKEHGKLRGNIEYREDKWLLNIVPIKFQNVKLTHTDGKYDDSKKSEMKSAKLRDKWCKVRIKYKGDKLAVISAIQTMFTVSFT